MPRATLVYDGDCGFCQSQVDAWRRWTGDAIEYLPSHELGERFAHIPRAELDRAVFLVDDAGRTTRAAEAVFELRALAGKGLGRALYRRLPGFAALSEWGYRRVAKNRHRLPGSTCRVPQQDAPHD